MLNAQSKTGLKEEKIPNISDASDIGARQISFYVGPLFSLLLLFLLLFVDGGCTSNLIV